MPFESEEQYLNGVDNGLIDDFERAVDHFGMKTEDMALAKSFGYQDPMDYEIDMHVGASLPYDWDHDNLSSPIG